MTTKTPHSQSQLDKFKQAARDLECDDDPVRFDAMVKKIAASGGKKPKDEKEG